MKKSKNPFYRLLGIKSSRPHHYKLLGVPRSADAKQVELAAKARLEQLKGGDPAQDAAQLEEVVAAIEKARSVLGDPDRRKAYDLKMDAAAANSKSNKETGNRRETDVSGKTYSQGDLLPPQLPGSSVESSGADEQETENPPAVAQPIDVADPSNIPLAVPLTSSTEPNEKSPAVFQQGERVGGDYDPVSGLKRKRPFSGKFRVRPRGKRGGKRSIMVPLLSMFFFVVGVAGLLFFVFKYMEMNGEAQLVGDPPTTVVPADKNQGDDPDKDNGSSQPTVNQVPMVEPENKPENEPTNSATGNSGSDDGETNSVKPDPEPTGSNSPEDETMDPESNEPDSPDDEGVTKKPEPRVLSFGEKAQFRRLIQRADRNLYQRKFDMAAESGRQAKAIIEGDPVEGNLSDESQELVELASAIEKMSDNLQGFWDQVIASGKENDGDIPIDDSGQKFVTVVDTGDDYIIVRSSGENLRYRYLEMPAGLAKDLAESGEKEDVPTWNIQKGTFYAVHRHIDLKYRDLALNCIALAEQDGHDLGYLRHYLKTDLEKIGSPASAVRVLDTDRLQSQIRDLKKEFEIPSRLASLSPQECETVSMRMAAEMDLLDQAQNLKRSALCEMIRQLAIQGRNVDLALESVEEQRVWAEFDVVDLKVDTLNDLAGQNLDPSNARLCVDSYIRFRKSNQADVVAGSKLRKLHKRVEELANKHRFSDLTRTLGQLQRP